MPRVQLPLVLTLLLAGTLELAGGLSAYLFVHELAAIASGVEHGHGLPGVAAHVGSTLLPVALLGVGAVALALGVVHVVRRHRGPDATPDGTLTVPRRPCAPRAGRDRTAPIAPLLGSHLAGRAPPAPAG